MTTELREGLAKALYEAFASRMGKPDQKWESATIQAREAFGADADTCLAYFHDVNEELKGRLDVAERALSHHGYRKSCDIPACNCGDRWNHGGHAAERLSEISSVTGDYWLCCPRHEELHYGGQLSGHDFQPGPCTCGHDRIVGSEG